MKKKLFQILMLFVATVSVGSFVSCKDTNEDLYNELRVQSAQQALQGATLAEALQLRVAQLEAVIAAYKTQLDALPTTDGIQAMIDAGGFATDIANLKSLITALQAKNYVEQPQLDAVYATLNGLITANTNDLATLKALDLPGVVATLQAARTALESRIAALELLVKDDPTSSIISRLSKVETELVNAKADLTAIQSRLTTAESTATTALTTATTASTRANDAYNLASSLQALVATAGANAAAAAAVADSAWNYAKTALEKAIAANTLAAAVQGLAQSNQGKITTLETNLGTLQTLVTNKFLEFTDSISALETKIKDIDKIWTKLNDVQNKVNGIDVRLSVVSDSASLALERAAEAKALAGINHAIIDSLSKVVTANKTDIDGLKLLVQELRNTVYDLNGDGNALTTRVTALETSVNTMSTTVSGLSEKYDSIVSNINNLKIELATLRGICDLNYANIKQLGLAQQEALKLILQNKDSIATNAKNIAVNANDIKWIKWYLEKIDSTFNNYFTKAELQPYLDKIAALEGTVSTIKETIKTELKTELNTIISDMIDSGSLGTDLVNFLKKDSTFVTKDDLKDIVDGIVSCTKCEAHFANIKDSLDTVFGDVAKLTTEVALLKAADSTMNKAIELNSLKIDTLKTQVSTIASNVATLRSDLTKVENRVTKAETRLDSVCNAVDALTKSNAEIRNYLNSQVTGVMIQGTHNPMFGTFNIPVNIQSNVLVAYYGVPKTKIEFPTNKTGNYLDASEALTAADMQMLGLAGAAPLFTNKAGVPLMNDGANAGKIYVTVNPTTKDFSGTQLKIVNTRDTVSYITLSPLRKSDAVLQFGYSRADNGFYEADAFVAKSDYDKVTKITMSKAELKESLKNVKDQITAIANKALGTSSTPIDLGEASVEIYNIIRGMRLEQSGLKCPFKDVDGNNQAVYSQYNLAATAINPISMGWLKDKHYYTMPGYEVANGLLDKIVKTAKDKIHVGLEKVIGSSLVKEIVGFKIAKIELGSLNEELRAKFKMTINDDVEIDGLTYHMQIPANQAVNVKYAETGLTLNGTPVNVGPDLAVTLDAEDTRVDQATVVIYGDITATSVPMKLAVPVVNDNATKVVWYDMEAAQLAANLVPAGSNFNLFVDGQKVSTFTPASGAYNVAPTSPTVTLTDMIDISSSTKPLLKFTFTVDMRGPVDDLWKEAQKALDPVNDMMKALQKILDDINIKLRNINYYETKIGNAISGAVDEYLRVYIDKINSVVVGFFNSINRRFGPFLVTSDVNGFKRMSESKEVPTVMTTNQLRIYPTTKNMELIVPLARKHVGVTNVYSLDLTKNVQAGTLSKSILDAANANLNTVIDGTQRMLEVTGVQAGYIYEVAYSALDFDGNIATKKYYFRVK